MRKVIEIVITLSFVSLAIVGSYHSHFHAQQVPHDAYTIIGEPIEITYPEHEVEIPEVHLASFEDEFTVKVHPIVPTLTEKDWELVESISIAEAGNQSVEGVASVQLVVLNRMALTGKSAREVIYAPGQFYTRGMNGTNELSADARALIESGWDESQGAIYFRNRHYHSFGTPLYQIGDHYFSGV